jgi:8-oxo-dGTP diphosphatase
MKNEINNFNLRVYGIVENAGRILVSHEKRFGKDMQKLPGGGIEKGEGIENALRREFKEELAVEILDFEFFYVNEFFQQSVFKSTDQLISFYYLVRLKDLKEAVRVSDMFEGEEEGHIFKWHSLKDLAPELFTFPIDRIVISKYLEKKNVPNKN